MQHKEHFPFTADHIGSEILARFSEDIYTPKAIIRELVKNGYDSYAELEKFLEDNRIDLDFDRVVKVDVADHSIVISDEGLGMDISGFNRLISIALTEKREIPGVTGFRGIGFWSAYTGGDAIIVESTKLNDPRLYRLTLNTKRMRERQGPGTSISAIMNDSDCVQLISDAAPSLESHYTKVFVSADSDDARLRKLVADVPTMRKLILEGCSYQLAQATRHCDDIQKFYTDHSVIPTKLIFQGEELLKEIPAGVGDFITKPIEAQIGGKRQTLAWIWYTTNTINKALSGHAAGIRVCWEGFPIGGPNLYSSKTLPDSSTEVIRPDLLFWHVGEVHLVAEALRPNASGEELRDSTLTSMFRDELRRFYETLIQIAFAKQRRVSLANEYQEHQTTLATMATRIAGGETLGADDKLKIQEISQTIEKENKQARGRPKEELKEGSRERLLREPDAKKNRRKIQQLLKQIRPNLDDDAGRSAKAASKNTKQHGSATTNTQTSTTGDSALLWRQKLLAVIDEIRDAISELLEDEVELRQELLDRVNTIVEGSST